MTEAVRSRALIRARRGTSSLQMIAGIYIALGTVAGVIVVGVYRSANPFGDVPGWVYELAAGVGAVVAIVSKLLVARLRKK